MCFRLWPRKPVRRLPSYDDDDGRYEIVDGRRVELPPISFFANQVAFVLGRKLADFADQSDLGQVTVDNLFRLPALLNRSRRPDVAFVSFQRWPKSRPLPCTENALEVVPELMVEVVSPTDQAEALQEKVPEYFQTGVRLVWVIYPVLSQVNAFTASPEPALVAARRRTRRWRGVTGLPPTTEPIVPRGTCRPFPLFYVNILAKIRQARLAPSSLAAGRMKPWNMIPSMAAVLARIPGAMKIIMKSLMENEWSCRP